MIRAKSLLDMMEPLPEKPQPKSYEEFMAQLRTSEPVEQLRQYPRQTAAWFRYYYLRQRARTQDDEKYA